MNNNNSSSNRSNNSLFDNSMKMVANLIKVTSFSIAKMSFGTTRPSLATKNHLGSDLELAVCDEFGGINYRQRSQEPQSSSKPVSYLIEPVDDDEGIINGAPPPYHHHHHHGIREEMSSVDGKASDYIRKVHEKNRYDSSEISTISASILPPPPHVAM